MFKLFHARIDVSSSKTTVNSVETVEKIIEKWGNDNPSYMVQEFKITSVMNDRNDFAEIFLFIRYKDNPLRRKKDEVKLDES